MASIDGTGRFVGNRRLRTIARKPVVPDEQMQVPEAPARLANGSIYQGSRGPQPLFEDRRPRMIGDTLTIELEEQVSASKTSSSNANRAGSMGLSLATTSSRASQVGDFGLDASTTHDFSGGGGSQANNSFTGTISVTVMQVMPNGNLRVRGDKQIAINQGTEFIRFSGVVNPGPLPEKTRCRRPRFPRPGSNTSVMATSTKRSVWAGSIASSLTSLHFEYGNHG